MKKQKIAEAHALERVLYMLEEGSVAHLSKQDLAFGQFIEQLYQTVNVKAHSLRSTTH